MEAPKGGGPAKAVMKWLAAALLCVLMGGAHAEESLAADREALEALYHATGGPDWSNRTNWLSAEGSQRCISGTTG